MIPNTISIGAGKAGSTSLHNYLSAHPRIFGSKEKELMYFTLRLNRGREWYQSHFPIQEGVEIYFETTPQYSFRDEYPGVPQRIYDYNPTMKLLYIVREPLSRIVSHFNHWARTQPHKYKDLEKSLALPAHRKLFVDRTRYFYQLSAYMDVFPVSQIKVVFLEDLMNDFVKSLNEVFGFLGVDHIAKDIPQEVHNLGGKRKSNSRQRRVNEISRDRRNELYDTLKTEVQCLLAHCNKPADFWGKDYI